MRKYLLKAFHRLYQFSRWNRTAFTPAGRMLLVLLLLTAVLGLDVSYSQFYQLFSLLFGLLLVAFISSRWTRPDLNQLKVTRILPRFATLNEAFSYRVQIENTGNRLQRQLLFHDLVEPARVSPAIYARVNPESHIQRNWFDRHVGYQRFVSTLHWMMGLLIQETEVADIGPGGSVMLNIEAKPLRRGYVKFAAVNLTATDPFGLYKRQNQLNDVARLLVLPQFFPVAAPGLSGRRCFQPGGVTQSSQVGDSTEFDGIREYRPGDPLKHLHWKSWARTGKPFVKQYQDEYFVRHALILDNYQTAGDPALFEEAVTLAASFANAQLGQDDLLDLIFAGDRIHRVTAGRGLTGSDQLLEILALLQTQPDAAFTSLQRSVKQNAATMSNAICVLLQWDERRQTLVSSLLAVGLPVLVILVVADEHDIPQDLGPMRAHAEHFHTVLPGGARVCLASL